MVEVKIVVGLVGGVCVALVLAWFLGMSGGQALNTVSPGSGTPLVEGANTAFTLLIIIVAVVIVGLVLWLFFR